MFRLFLLFLLALPTAAQTRDTPYERATAIIQAAAARDATTLDLSNMRLERLPPEIGQLDRLEVLNLAYNPLTELPPEIGQLTQLNALFLSYNRLMELPPEIGQLAQLELLYVDHNPLTNLPLTLEQIQTVRVRSYGVPHLEAFRYGDGWVYLRDYFRYPRPIYAPTSTVWLTLTVLAGCLMLAGWSGMRYLRWLGRSV